MKKGMLLLGLLWALSAAQAWDAIGHMIICQEAYDRLTPAAKARVDQSIEAFNRENHTDYTFVSAGCWMDDIRGKTKEYNTWHYIDLPYNPEGEPFPGESEQNALWAIRLCTDILNGKKTYPGINKDQALVMLMHLVGDIHQPLHTCSRAEDAGGNKIVVPNIQDAKSGAFPVRKNLHAFWDTSYRRSFKDGEVVELYPEPPYLVAQAIKGHNDAAPLVLEQATLLEKSYSPDQYPAGGDPQDWVRQSHSLAYNLGYQQLPGGDAANPVNLDQPYVDNARSAAQQKLIQAGRRLGDLLNIIYR